MFKLLKFEASKLTRLLVFALVFALIAFVKIYNQSAYQAQIPKGSHESLGTQFENIATKFKEVAPEDLLAKSTIKKYEVNVKRVIDGDTFIDTNDNRYRIAFIDAPEKKQAFGNEASVFLKSLIEDQNIKIKNLYKDKYGRIVAKAYFDNVDIAHVLVEYGYAWNQANAYNADKDYAEKLDELENSAKLNKKGLWALSDNILPFEFRSKAGQSD